MSFAPDEIRRSYAACHRVCRRSGSNFPVAFLLLPREKRKAMDALYAFMRHSDDLADDPQSDRSPADALRDWRRALDEALMDPAPGADANCWSVCRSGATGILPVPNVGQVAKGPPGRQIGNLPHGTGETPVAPEVAAGILPALADTVRRFAIPPEHLYAVLDGVERDLVPQRFQAFDELAGYCHLVASAVGMACICIWGHRGPEALPPARSAGLALQLTNILRDVKEDAARGRVYLPLDDLAACGYSIDELRSGVVNAAFHRLMALEIDRAEQFYREAAELPRWLHPDGRPIFGLMTATYHALLNEIRRRPGDIFLRRIRVSRPKKLWIAARSALFSR
jgi:phytoene synthase